MKRSRLKRKTRLNPRNEERLAKRRAEQFGPQAEWCRTLPCCVPSCRARAPSDPAHLRSRGAGGKDKANVVPLCRVHHTEQHTVGLKTFQEIHDVDLWAVALALASHL